MAKEASVSASLQFAKGSVGAEALAVSGKTFDVTGADFIKHTFSVPTTAGGTTLPLGGLTSTLGWALFKNNDATNYVEILTVISTGVAMAKIPAGGTALFYFPSSVTAPAALANTGTVQLQYMIVKA